MQPRELKNCNDYIHQTVGIMATIIYNILAKYPSLCVVIAAMSFLQDDIICYIKLQATSFIVYQVAGRHIFLPLSYMTQAAMFSSNKVQAATELPSIFRPVKLSFRISQIFCYPTDSGSTIRSTNGSCWNPT